jgi:hypothetical protein
MIPDFEFVCHRREVLSLFCSLALHSGLRTT